MEGQSEPILRNASMIHWVFRIEHCILTCSVILASLSVNSSLSCCSENKDDRRRRQSRASDGLIITSSALSPSFRSPSSYVLSRLSRTRSARRHTYRCNRWHWRYKSNLPWAWSSGPQQIDQCVCFSRVVAWDQSLSPPLQYHTCSGTSSQIDIAKRTASMNSTFCRFWCVFHPGSIEQISFDTAIWPSYSYKKTRNNVLVKRQSIQTYKCAVMFRNRNASLAV